MPSIVPPHEPTPALDNSESVTTAFSNTPPEKQTKLASWIDCGPSFWTALLLVTFLKTLAGCNLGLIFDECTYWNWSLHPQACYYDHPPLTAWLIDSGHALFGHTTLAVRFWALVSGVLLALAGRLLAKDMFGEAAGNRAGIFLLLAPIFAGNSLLMTPDTYLAPAWAFALFFAWKGSCHKASIIWWLAAGAAIGVGMLSKYTMVLFYPSLALFWLISPGKRARIALGSSMAAIVSFILFFPVFWWNRLHNWISFERQFNHGFQNEHHSLINFQNLSDYTAFLIVLVSPLLGLSCFRSAATRLSDERYRYLALFFWCVVLFFGLSAAKAHIEANWPMAAFITGLIMVAGDWERYCSIWRKSTIALLLIVDIAALGAAAWLSLPKYCPLAVTNLSFNPSFIKGFPGSEKVSDATRQGFADFQSRVEEFLGPAEVADAVTREFRNSNADFLCLSTIQLTGVLSFYSPELEPLLWLPDHGRVRLPWINDYSWAGKNALIVEWPRPGPYYGGLFSSLTPKPKIEVPQIRSPILISFGHSYDPTKVQNR